MKNVVLVLLSMFFVAIIFNVPVSGYDDDIDDPYDTMAPIVSLKGTLKTLSSQSTVILEKVKMTKEEIEKLGKR